MESETTGQTQPSKQSTSPMLIGGIVLTILLIGGGFFLFSGKNNSGDSQSTLIPTNAQKQAISDTPSLASPTPVTQAYTLEEVATHNTETDCWMVIEGKVYDATMFIPTHPGGKAIIKGCGTNATTLFTERPTNNKGPHPSQAIEKLKELYIGDLKS